MKYTCRICGCYTLSLLSVAINSEGWTISEPCCNYCRLWYESIKLWREEES